MAWRKWIRSVLDWLGLAAQENDAAQSVAPEQEPSERGTAVSPSTPPPSSFRPASPVAAKSVAAFNLRLLEVGPDRESVIYLLHEMSGLSLRQIRTLVDAAPVQVLLAIDAHTGRAVQHRLASLGASSELVGGQVEEVESSAEAPVDRPIHPDNTFFLFGDYDVLLQAAGPQSLQVVQILRDLLNGRTLDEVERMVANAPQRIVKQVPLETAETIKTRLERAGAVVEVVARKTA